MPKKRSHHFRSAGARIDPREAVQKRGTAGHAILTFVCAQCGERRDYEYEQKRPIDADGNTLKLKPFDQC
jgi:hypothetical protein